MSTRCQRGLPADERGSGRIGAAEGHCGALDIRLVTASQCRCPCLRSSTSASVSTPPGRSRRSGRGWGRAPGAPVRGSRPPDAVSLAPCLSRRPLIGIPIPSAATNVATGTAVGGRGTSPRVDVKRSTHPSTRRRLRRSSARRLRPLGTPIPSAATSIAIGMEVGGRSASPRVGVRMSIHPLPGHRLRCATM